MTAMHGVLSAEETPGGGLTVTLSLPLAGKSDALPLPSPAGAAS